MEGPKEVQLSSSARAQQTTKKRGPKRKHATSASELVTQAGPARRRKPANSGFGRGKKALERVHELLKSLGVEKPEEVGSCLKAGIINGHVRLLPSSEDPQGILGLDQILATGRCLICSKELSCSVRDVLWQPDYGGNDFEDGGKNATFRCDGEECCGIYVSRICLGFPRFGSGKFHNHCTQCPKFGKCIGDYREEHCGECGRHYFAGSMGQFPCPRCSGEEEEEEEAYNGNCSSIM